MKAVVSVASLEVSRRILLLPTALVVGFTPFVIYPLLRIPSAQFPMLGLVGAWVLVLVVGGILGATVIGGDLGAGRLSFFFSRPLTGWAIFAGKILAAAVLTIVSGFLTALPVLVFTRALADRPYITRFEGALLFLGVTVVVLLAGHLLGVVVRARSPWLILDVAMLTLSIWTLDHLFARLRVGDAPWPQGDQDLQSLIRLVWFLVGVLATASLVQVVVGRTDLARSHRAASLTFWPLFLILPAGLALYVSWLSGSTPADLTEVWGMRSTKDGRYVSFEGPARGGRIASFILDTKSQAHVQRGIGVALTREMAFSPDGSRAVWPALTDDRKVKLKMLDLRQMMAPPGAAVLSPWPAPWWRRELRLGPSGEQALFLDPHLSVYETATGTRMLWVPDRPGESFLSALFISGFRVRAYGRGATGLEILEAPLPGGPAVVVGRLEMSLPKDPQRQIPRLRFDRNGTRMLVIGEEPLRVLLADAREGTVLREIPVATGPVDAVFLNDGRIAVAETRAVRLMPAEGGAAEVRTLEMEVDRGFAPRAVEVRPAGPDHVVVSLLSFPFVPGRLVVVDLRVGKVVRTEQDVSLLGGDGAAEDGTVLLRGDGPSLVRYDVITGARAVLWSRNQITMPH